VLESAWAADDDELDGTADELSPDSRSVGRLFHVGAANSWISSLSFFGSGSNPLIRHFLSIDRYQNNND
jgi:hypothetical protein